MTRAAPDRAGFLRARDELVALFEEVAEVDWRHPAWSALVALLAADEARTQRRWSPERAVEAYVTALQANSSTAADTFMATHAAPPPRDRAGRIALAVSRARAMASTLSALDRATPDQRLLSMLALRGGWLCSMPIVTRGAVPIAFLLDGNAYVAAVRPDEGDDLARALAEAGRGYGTLVRVDPSSLEPTRAAATVSIDPVPLSWARSFHRLAWTRGGGPWTGVADSPPYAVVSTCHAAVDGYVHARVSSAVLESAEPGRVRPVLAPAAVPVSPLVVGFATQRIDGDVPRFASALHAFAEVLDRRLGTSATRSVPFHVPIAPGAATDVSRWRRRPLYALMALEKRDGQLEDLDAFTARLPAWLAREAGGSGILTRVLRSALEAPLPRPLRRRLIARQAWMDRWIAPARTLTGGGYVSWMRFPAGEAPSIAIFPSAVPSFSADRGGAGLSIVVSEGRLTAGLTTSGRLGSSDVAQEILDEWVAAVRDARERRVACASAS